MHVFKLVASQKNFNLEKVSPANLNFEHVEDDRPLIFAVLLELLNLTPKLLLLCQLVALRWKRARN